MVVHSGLHHNIGTLLGSFGRMGQGRIEGSDTCIYILLYSPQI
jgi:hypothetical protein